MRKTHTFTSNPFSGIVLALALVVASATTPSTCHAQTAPAASQRVESSPKGIIGLGLLGAELGLFVPALFPARDWWPYVVFPIVGAAGGAIGGYFLEQATPNQPEISIALLIAGVVLAVPTVVGTLALTQFQPSAAAEEPEPTSDAAPTAPQDGVEAVEDPNADTGPAQQAPAQEESPVAPATSSAGPSAGLLNVSPSGLRPGIPTITMTGRYTARELTAMRMTQDFDWNVPVVSGTF